MAAIPKDPYAKPVLIGGLVLIGATVVVLLANLFNTIKQNQTVGAEDNSMYVAVTNENIKPIGTVTAVDKTVAPQARTGEQVYNAVCTACHASGVLGAPKLDKADWTDRVTKGLQGLLTSAINGLNQMPPRGGDPSVTDKELSDAVVYMTSQAGYNLADQAGDTTQQAAAPAEATTAPAATTQAAASAETQPATPAEPAAAPAEQAQVAAGIDGEKIYRGICFTCHDSGLINSPKLGDKAAWEPRIAAGMDTLYTHSIQGFNAMPAKGGNPALSDDEVKAAVDFMVAKTK